MDKIRRTIRRRRKEGKTDYKARFSFLKSGMPRVIVRKTNRYIVGQIVVSDIAQDKVIVGVVSKDLLGKGWPEKLSGSLKSLPAAYLTGYYLGKKSKEIKEGILDLGLQRNVHKSRIYAFVKGLRDSGFSVPCSEDAMPSEEMLMKKPEIGKLIKTIREALK